MRKLTEGLLKKSLKVKKAPSVQGSICIHFPNPEVKDIVLKDFTEVEVFKRLNITLEDVKRSNIQQLVLRGDLVIC